MRITQPLHRTLQRDPDRLLTICADRRRTVAESTDRIARLAGGIADLGVTTDERVALLSLNSDRYHEFLYAAAWGGFVAVPLNIRWTVAENAFAIRDAGIEVLLVDELFAAMVPAIRELAPGLRTIVSCADEPPAHPDWIDYETLLAASAPLPDQERGGTDLFGIFYTGGTTGEPKGVMLSHNNMMNSAMGTLATYPLVSIKGQLLHAAPMFHLADIAMWCCGNLTGSTHVMVPAFEPVTVMRAIAEHKATDVILVPTMLQMLADHPQAGEFDLSSMVRVAYGASPISEAVLERAMKVLPCASFAQGYGMTELSPIATILLPEDHQDPTLRRSAGRSAAAAEVRVVDPDDVELPRGEIGEVVVRSEGVMLGYWNRPEETAQALRGGWMHTGDGGYMDDAGYVFIVDRIKDMIVTGGENVYSVEVENALARHDAVASCAVIGIPDDRFGERVHAAVVLLPGSAVTADELTDFCREHIANYKVPRSVEFRDALPTSGAGKILKRELRAQYWGDGARNVH